MKPFRTPTIVDHSGDLSKQWYVYFRYWDSDKKKLVKARKSKFPNGISPNRIKSKRERTKQFHLLRDAIEYLLNLGWTPKSPLPDQEIIEEKIPEVTNPITIVEAVDKVVEVKKAYLSQFGFRSFKAKAKDFRRHLVDQGMGKWPPQKLSRSHITEYLRNVKATKGKNGTEASARTRNNYLTELHALFEKMIEEELLQHNPCKGITTLTESVERHVAFSKEDMHLMGQWMEQEEPYLKKFSYFIGYAFLRPIEILRLKVKDIQSNEIHLRAAGSKTKTSEIIPIIDKLKPIVDDILQQTTNPDHFLFTAQERPGSRMVGGTQYFSKRFGKCKEYMRKQHGRSFTENHTLYGLRHTFIKDIYLHFRQSMTREQAEFYTMRITRHKTSEALRAYIRDYSVDLPKDWGDAYSIEY